MCQAGVGQIVLRRDEAAAGFLVEPVDDAGSQFAADAAEILAVMQQRVDQRAIGVARGGMDDKAGGFVDHDEMLVLEQDIERDVLRQRGDRLGSGM